MCRKTLLGLAVFAGLLFLRLVSAEPVTRTLPNPATPGRFTLTLKSGGFDRAAHLHLPAGYKANSKPPLVLVLHGAGGSGSGALDRDGWTTKADKEGFLVVAPDGLPAFPRLDADFRTNPRLWNSGQLRARAPRATIDDVTFVRELLDDLKARVPYDAGQVFCAGHSNGGGMTFRLATELSERLTAIGTVAGMMALENPKPKKPLPTLYIIGTKDPLMPLAGGEVKLPWGSRQNPPVAEPLTVWAKALGCQPEPRTLSEKDGLKKVEYPSKTNGPTLTIVFIDGHGHHWPGAKSSLPESMIGPMTSKLNATDTLWEFFQASKPAPK